jgi:uncharacterized protein
MKKTLLIGASTSPERYANRAAQQLKAHGHDIVMLGRSEGEVAGERIQQGKPALAHDIDTVTLYIAPQHQPEWYDYIQALQPKRVVFNPGTENPPFAQHLETRGIEALEACTLVMLSLGNY